MKNILFFLLISSCILISCKNTQTQVTNTAAIEISPVFITDSVKHDSDDPAIWVHPTEPNKSLIIATDKDLDGALYVFDLEGKVQHEKTITHLKRPNNVDIEYGLLLNGVPTDIAVTTERITHKLRVFSLPDMQPIDNGGIEVFENENEVGFRDLMGIALYKNKKNEVFAIVGRKTVPKQENTFGNICYKMVVRDKLKPRLSESLVFIVVKKKLNQLQLMTNWDTSIILMKELA